MLKITLSGNGATVSGLNEGSLVFEFDKDDMSGLVDMLYTLVDNVTMTGKYDRERIEIKIDHGRGYECKDKKCKICKGG